MLGVILGHVELAILKMDPSPTLRASLVEIQKAAKRSFDLTRQLLAFARKEIVAPEVLDLNETMAGMLNMLQRLIGEDVHLHWHPATGLWPIRVDPSQICQVLVNLCINARDAITGVGTNVTIQTENRTLSTGCCSAQEGFVQGDYVLLAVSDNGIGMDKETMAHIFEPFFTTKKAGMGTGLGLATVYGIAKQNGGFINVNSEPGKGTTFTIYLPRHLGKATQSRTDHETRQTMRGQETVLVVEDEPSLLKMITLMLETEGYIVLPATTPGEAIRLAGEHPDELRLLVTDVVMSEMNGRDLAEKVLPLCSNLKCLFMSGYPAEIIALHGVLGEGTHFLRKPFSLITLSAKVREVLDSKKERKNQ